MKTNGDVHTVLDIDHIPVTNGTKPVTNGTELSEPKEVQQGAQEDEVEEAQVAQLAALTMALGEAERARLRANGRVDTQLSGLSAAEKVEAYMTPANIATVKSGILGKGAGHASPEKIAPEALRRAATSKTIASHLERFEMTSTSRRTWKQRFMLRVVLWFFPACISVWYATAVFFEPSVHEDHPALFWTPGVLKWVDGKPDGSPKDSLCSHGWGEVLLLVNSRLTAYAMYVSECLVFASKCHASIRFLSRTFVAEIVPLHELHGTHHFQGILFCVLAASHTITHVIRWAIREELDFLWCQAGLSGIVAMVLMLLVVCSMQCGCVRKKVTFEFRFNLHWLFVPLCIALCAHAERTLVITLSASLVWLADYLYVLVFATYRLDLVEFTRLEDGGVQMLWMNPPGFEPNSGEFLKVQLPWLQRGGSEWHAFSLYKQEFTQEGLASINKKVSSLSSTPSKGRVYNPAHAKGGQAIDTTTTCILLIEFQNEFCTPGGKLHDGVEAVMRSTDMIAKVEKLVKVAREVGIKIIHAPITFAAGGRDNPNKGVGILKDCLDKELFVEGTWGADFHRDMGPKYGDIIVQGKKGLDAFPGTDLEELLTQNGIHTVILGGFLTDCCVESTMRTAYEMGFNTITLIDGCATFSEEAQKAATQGTFLKFSTPMTCQEVCSELRKRHTVERVLTMAKEDGLEHEKETQPLVDMIAANAAHTVGATSVADEVRLGMASKTYKTTQIFMMPVGDWTRQVSDEVSGARRHRTCWVRGPYMSPYSIAKDFSHLLLFATGIGITPAFGIMGQYQGASKTKILVWSTRSLPMLKFFAPMLREAQVAFIYYTGKPKLSVAETYSIRESTGSQGVFIFQKRPELIEVMSTVICTFEGVSTNLTGGSLNTPASLKTPAPLVHDVMTVDKHKRATWCGLYCGGSHYIMNTLRTASKKIGIGFDAELFDW